MKIYGVDTFTIKDVMAILKNPKNAKLNKEATQKILKSQKNVQKIVASDRTVYGINTGFGPLCDVKISEAESIFISASNRNECKEEVYQIVQQIINENARPASRAYKSAAVRGLLYDLIDSLYDQTFPCS